jgi:peptidoglycan endopeptidase LytE
MPNANMPKQPSGWKDWKFWQYSEAAIVEGVTDDLNRPTKIDLNWFRGSEAELYQFANLQPAEPQTYTVQAGDSLLSIAEKHGLSLMELLDANPSLLQVGATLTIPGRISIPQPPDETGTVTTSPVEPSGGTTGGTTGTKTYTVKMGDTLSAIALKHRTTVDAIIALNPQITNRNIIFDGQVIKIP